MRGSGSVTTIAKDLFVPSERVLQMGPVLQGQHLSKLNADAPIFKAPFMPTACATISAPALGLAMGAKDAFLERLPGRKITYTSYENQSEAPITHLEIAEAITRIDEVGFHAHRAAARSTPRDGRGSSGRSRSGLVSGLTWVPRASGPRRRSTSSTGASGGSSIYRDVPIQRIQRDVQTLNLHAILHPNTNLELYGRILCGLGPNTPYI